MSLIIQCEEANIYCLPSYATSNAKNSDIFATVLISTIIAAKTVLV